MIKPNQKRKDLDKILRELDTIKNSSNTHRKVNQIITRSNLANDYFIELENTLIADSFTAVNRSTYTNGSINDLAITYTGAKFISKGGYVIEHRKDNAFKTDLLFKILTAVFTLITIGLTVYTNRLGQTQKDVTEKFNERVDSLENELIKTHVDIDNVENRIKELQDKNWAQQAVISNAGDSAKVMNDSIKKAK